MATKKATKAKTTQKKAPAKKAAPAKAKAVKKAPAKKAAPKKAAAKKAAPKKAAAKKAPAKKAAAKKTAKKTTASKPTVKKAPAKKAAAKKAVPKKAPAKKAAAKKPAKKKKAVRVVPPKSAKEKKAAKERIAAMLKPKPKPKHVGQAPRKTTVAASIPVPTHTPPKETPQADAKASKNLEASTDAKQDFRVHDQVVYPAHGVGKIVKLEKQEVAGISIELFVINFEQEKMRLRVPTGKAKAAGMRPLSSDKAIKDAITTLKGRARIKRTMWSRRAQEYDSKINSGDIKLVAEVVRDLFRAGDQPEQSYSERQLFEAALDRMAREVAAVHKVDLGKAIEELDSTLQKKAAAASAAAAATAAAAAAAAEAEAEAEKNDAA